MLWSLLCPLTSLQFPRDVDAGSRGAARGRAPSGAAAARGEGAATALLGAKSFGNLERKKEEKNNKRKTI